jgi:dihydroflavonol-4-reductase
LSAQAIPYHGKMAFGLPRRALVLGARGFLGEHVVQQLLMAGVEAVVAVRVGSGPFSISGVSVVEGDYHDADFLRRALSDVDAAVFCAGRTWQPGLPIAEYQRQNVGVTQAFFDALGDRPDFRVVFTSSLSAVGGSKAPIVFQEDTGRDAIDEGRLSPYDWAKIEAEEIALASARRGNQVVVLNPGLLLGPGATPTSNLAAPYYLLWLCQGQFAAKFYVNGGVTLSDVRDVAQAHVAALTRGQPGQRCILGGHNLDRRDFYRRVARLTGLRPPRALPAWLLTTLMTANDGLAWLTRGLIASPVHRSFARTQKLYYYGASERAERDLGYAVTPLETTLVDMLRHYHDRQLLPPSMSFTRILHVDNARELVLLRQLAASSGYAGFLLPRLPDVYATVRSNQVLDETLTSLRGAGVFDDSRGRWRFPRAAGPHLETFRRFFEYVYFSSNDFLSKVL